MPYSIDDTIAIFSVNDAVYELVNKFAKNRSFQVFICESEADLIAIPCKFSIVDINKLSENFFDYLRESADNDSANNEKFISVTTPATALAKEYAKHFCLNTNLSLSYLNKMVQ